MLKIEKMIHSIVAKHYNRKAQIDSARAQRLKALSEVTTNADLKSSLNKQHQILNSRAKTAEINKDYHKSLSVDVDITIDPIPTKEPETKKPEVVVEPIIVEETIAINDDVTNTVSEEEIEVIDEEPKAGVATQAVLLPFDDDTFF